MAIINESDDDDNGEIGRGRKKNSGDSSSSRESSSHNYSHRIRAPTPVSDDGIVIPEDPDASPPPSQMQPIIRQAVAFGSILGQNPASIPTYKAVSQEIPPYYFLPGQTILPPVPPDQISTDYTEQPLRFSAYQPPVTTMSVNSVNEAGPPIRGGRKRTSSGRKKKHFNDGFAPQTDKFRVDYNFSDDPNAPTPPFEGDVDSPQPTTATLETQSANTSPAAFGNLLPEHSSYLGATPDASTSLQVTTSYPTSQETFSQATSSQAVTSSSSSSRKGKSKGKGKSQAKSAPSNPSGHSSKAKNTSGEKHSNRQAGKHRAEAVNQDTNSNSNADTSGSNYAKYYRFDYEKQRPITPDWRPTPEPSHTTAADSRLSSPVSKSKSHARKHASPPVFSTATAPGNSRSSVDRTSYQPSAARGPLRMVTLLIKDVRTGQLDSQVAEATVHLKQADNPEFGFWANAREIAEQLQAGPSRIDGPARVFSMRGEYRQFFLRVSQDNVDNIASANLAVDKDRSIQVYVENLPPTDGTVPKPPVVVEVVGSDSDTGNGKEQKRTLTRNPSEYKSKKRRRETSISSLASSGHHNPSPFSPSTMSPSSSHAGVRSPSPLSYQSSHVDATLKKPKVPKTTRSREETYQWQTSSSATTAPGLHGSSGHPDYYSTTRSATSLDPSSYHSQPMQPSPNREEVNKRIVDYVKPLIEEDLNWVAYMQSKATVQTATQIVAQYNFVQDKVNQISRATTPGNWLGAPRQRISKTHVLKALNLTTQWGADCTETLKLLPMYGPDGTRYTDSRIVDIMNEHPRNGPITPGNAGKRLLNMLREIHSDWLTEHPEDED